MIKLFRMGIIAILLVAVVVFTTPHVVFSQTKTPSPTNKPSASPEQSEIDEFKEKLASQVAKLTEKERRAIAGTVIAIIDDSYTIDTAREGEFEVGIDPDLTKFFEISGASEIEEDLTDIKKGDYIIVNGSVAGDSIEANIIYRDEEFVVEAGKVAAIETSDSSIEVVTLDQDTYTLDITQAVRLELMDIDSFEVARTSFSTIKTDDSIHFVIRPGSTKNDRHTPVRVLIVPQEYFIK